jgi:hypothetical protein
LAFTFDTKELNVRLPATGEERHRSKRCGLANGTAGATVSERTFREFTKALLHVRHRIPLRLLLLLRRITATALLLLRVINGRVRTLRIGELAHLLLLLPLRDLVAGVLLLILEQQLARKLLIQLGLFNL